MSTADPLPPPTLGHEVVQRWVPSFRQLATELIDGFSTRGQVEFISEFAEPYATRVIRRMLGLPEEEWPRIAHWAETSASPSASTARRTCRSRVTT